MPSLVKNGTSCKEMESKIGKSYFEEANKANTLSEIQLPILKIILEDRDDWDDRYMYAQCEHFAVGGSSGNDGEPDPAKEANKGDDVNSTNTAQDKDGSENPGDIVITKKV